MAPLRHAVRLVDREQRQPGAGLHLVEQPQAALAQQTLGRDVHQIEFAGAHPALDCGCFGAAQRAVEEGGAHAQLAERSHLVLHQRDQRRDHHAHAGEQQRRDLVSQRLAAAGGHQHQRIAAADHVLDHLALEAAEAGIAEHLVEQGIGVARARGNVVHRPKVSEIGVERTVRRTSAVPSAVSPASAPDHFPTFRVIDGKWASERLITLESGSIFAGAGLARVGGLAPRGVYVERIYRRLRGSLRRAAGRSAP